MSSSFTLESLSNYDGSQEGRPIYLSVSGKVHDVTSGNQFYGPNGPYHAFAGKECARALALMSVDALECTGDLTGLDERQLTTLQQWKTKLTEKYPVVGHLELS